MDLKETGCEIVDYITLDVDRIQALVNAENCFFYHISGHRVLQENSIPLS
jgi:hypothetical protein